jgi:hypothetical protein
VLTSTPSLFSDKKRLHTLSSTNTDASFVELVETIKHFEKLRGLGYYNDEKDANTTDESGEDITPLIQDIEQLTDILGGIVQRENAEVYEVSKVLITLSPVVVLIYTQ